MGSEAIAEGLKILAAAQGLSVEAYLQQLVERELPVQAEQTASSESRGAGKAAILLFPLSGG